MDLSEIDVNALEFGAAFTQNNGQKIVPLSMVAGRFDFDSRLRIQFGADEDSMLVSEYGLSTPMPGTDPMRRNLEITVSPEMEAKLRALDEKIATTAAERCNDFFKTATLNKQHMPVLRKSSSGSSVVRVKVVLGNVDNATKVRALQEDNVSTVVVSAEAMGKNTLMIAVADTPGIWSSATQFGISFTARGLIVRLPAPKGGLGMFNLKRKLVDVTPAASSDDPSPEVTPEDAVAPAVEGHDA